MTFDVIVTWPRNCEYPLFREFIRVERPRFGKVIIIFTDHNSAVDYSDFVREAMKENDITFLNTPKVEAGQDWRNVAINAALAISTSPWIWFMEQDFLIKDEQFWKNVESLGGLYKAFAIFQGPRLHPCCFFIDRQTLDKTGRNFGIVPDKLDHFGLIQQNLEDLNIEVYPMATGFSHHMNGLSHNFYLATEMKEIVYNFEEFKRYLAGCLRLDTIPLDPRFVKVAKSILLD